jgi:hypothetical protein
MGRDLLIMTGISLGTALMAWGIWGNPEQRSALHMQTVRWVRSDAELKWMSEQSRYMGSAGDERAEQDGPPSPSRQH